MDNIEHFAVSGEAVNTYMDNCEQILQGYLQSLDGVESLQEIIDMNYALAMGYLAALDALKSEQEPTH